MMHVRWRVIWAVCASVGAHAKDTKTASPGGRVDWAEGMVRATGSGAPDFKAQNPAQIRAGAERVAVATAEQNLLAMVKGLSVDGAITVGALMEKEEVRKQVDDITRSYRVSRRRYFSDNGVELEIEVPLFAFADVVDSQVSQLVLAKPTSAAMAYTGLIIDARGLHVTPSLMPRLLDAQGRAVYTIDFLSADARKQSAVATYVQSLEAAKKSRKAGEKPLVLKATQATGADLQLGAEDTKKLAATGTGFLADGKVVIVNAL